MIIKRIDPISAGKISGIIGVAIGLIAGVLFFLFGSMMAGMLASQNSGAAGAGSAIFGGIAGIFVLPIMYGVFGFIGGLVQAFIYNIAAGWVGGIRIETE